MDRNNMDLEIAKTMKQYERGKSNEDNMKSHKYKKEYKENDELNELELPDQENKNSLVYTNY